MSRTISSALSAHLATRAHKLAVMIRLDLKDGSVLAFTDHNETLNFDLGDGAADYQPWTGINPSAVTLVTGLEASNMEMSGPISSLVTRNAVLGGRYRGAVARMFMVNWSSLADGVVAILKGEVGEGRVEGSRFVLEVRGLAWRYNDSWGRVLSPICTAVFGDSSTGCPVIRTPYPATVTVVTDDFRFRVNLAGAHPNDFFNYGSVAFLTGALANTVEMPIIDYAGSTGAVELLEPLVDQPQVGDTLNLYRGCSLLLKSDDPNLPTCYTYGAVEDFRGFPEVPGSRFYHRVSAPGASYA